MNRYLSFVCSCGLIASGSVSGLLAAQDESALEPQQASAPLDSEVDLESYDAEELPAKEILPKAASDDLPIESTASDIEKFLAGEQAEKPKDWPKGKVKYPFRTLMRSIGPDGNASQRTTMAWTSADADAEDLSMHQRHGIYVVVVEMKIRAIHETLQKAKDEAEKQKILAELERQYARRYEIDTAYQKLKVQEIERRAKALRDELDQREASGEEWVAAMVTLAKMQSSGIETMLPGGGPPKQAEQLPASSLEMSLPPAPAATGFQTRAPVGASNTRSVLPQPSRTQNNSKIRSVEVPGQSG